VNLNHKAKALKHKLINDNQTLIQIFQEMFGSNKAYITGESASVIAMTNDKNPGGYVQT
jgi:hypothetical protein